MTILTRMYPCMVVVSLLGTIVPLILLCADVEAIVLGTQELEINLRGTLH